MNRATHAIACSLLCTVIAGTVTGCSAAKPKTEDFASSIAQSTNGYDIKDIKCEAFADRGQEKAGRASCRGTLALISNLYAPMSNEEIDRALVAAGIPVPGAAWFRARHPKTILAKAAAQGAEAPFSAECSYSGVVDGWNVGCSTSYQRFAGQPLGSRGDGSIASGGPEYTAYVNEVLADYRRLDAAYKEVKTQIDRFFGPGRTLTSPALRARVTSPLVWSGNPGFLGYPGYFSLETKYEDLREHTTGTFCGYPIGNPRDDILFAGNIDLNKDRETGAETFVARVQMQNRAIQYQNRYQGCSMHYRWNGTTFRAPYTPAELRSQ